MRIVLSLVFTVVASHVIAADIVLLPDGVWTADGDATHHGWGVRVHEGAVAAVGPVATLDAPADATRIDLAGTTLTPGLIDVHSHLLVHPYNETPWNDQVLKEPEDYRTLKAAEHARTTLLAGFTTLRDLATEGAGHADVSLKRAIEEGVIPGARLFVATRAIVSATERHDAGEMTRAPSGVATSRNSNMSVRRSDAPS
jgi:imidazolonepropionase-like amidohydrolase